MENKHHYHGKMATVLLSWLC